LCAERRPVYGWQRVPRTSLCSALSAGVILLAAGLPARAGETTHVVAPGQTLGRIAKRYHVTVEALRDANDLKPGQTIHPGLELQVPEPGEARKRAGSIAHGSDHSAQASRGEDFARRPKKPGTVHLVRGEEHFDAQIVGKKGKLNAPALGGLSNILRFGPNGAKTNIDPRLATLIGMVSDHFGGRPLHVVSGFRPYSPTQYTPHSNHNVGRAIDFFVEGVPNAVLRDYCRQFHDAGVGFYPNSAFVHLDVRSGQTYWLDYSKAGEAPRYDGPPPATPPDEARRDVDTGQADQGMKSNGADSAMGQ
jgi:uncharacterized protein YcbK (DUF882 family)